MQPLIQEIFSQIIDSSPYLPERFCDISCRKFPFKKKSYLMELVFVQKFTINAKKISERLKCIWSGTFAICSMQPFWLWSRIRSRVKKSHYIQPSTLSSAFMSKDTKCSYVICTEMFRCFKKKFRKFSQNFDILNP